MADEQVANRKLSGDEKEILIDFFEKNKPLWSSGSQFRDKEEKDSTKEKLIKPFDKKYTVDILEKIFHAFRTAFIRKHKEKVGGQDPNNKKWKFYDWLQYLKEEIEKPKKAKFEVEERELLIDLYKSHPSVWNHNTTDYRDRNLCDFLLDK